MVKEGGEWGGGGEVGASEQCLRKQSDVLDVLRLDRSVRSGLTGRADGQGKACQAV